MTRVILKRVFLGFWLGLLIFIPICFCSGCTQEAIDEISKEAQKEAEAQVKKSVDDAKQQAKDAARAKWEGIQA